MQLKGKVKTLAIDSTEEYTFNQAGMLTSNTYMHEVTTFEFTNGKLTGQITTWNYEEGSESDTMSFTYGTSGKYLPLYPEGIVTGGLFKNLASMKDSWSTSTFVTSGDSMLMIRSYEQQQSMATAETAVSDTICSFSFNGGLFPVTIRSRHGLTTITYAADGRFLTVQENYFYRSELTTFKSNSNYLLPISKVSQYVGSETSSTTTYTYNDNEDLIRKEYGGTIEEYGDYVYDSKGNWTSRSYREKYGQGDWSEKITETRTITYWD